MTNKQVAYSEWLHPGWETEWDGLRFHHTSKNDVQFKTDNKLFISGILHLVFLGLGCPWIIKTKETETVVKGKLIHVAG